MQLSLHQVHFPQTCALKGQVAKPIYTPYAMVEHEYLNCKSHSQVKESRMGDTVIIGLTYHETDNMSLSVLG